MMGLSQTTGYAVHALCCLEDPTCHPRLIRDIAECTAIPKPYLAKIINQLSRKGLVTTKRGYRGGIFLTRPSTEISLLDVVEAIEGKAWIGECLLGMDDYTAYCVCPTQKIWKKIRGQIQDALRNTSLASVVQCMIELKRKVGRAPQTSSGSQTLVRSRAGQTLKPASTKLARHCCRRPGNSRNHSNLS